MNDSPITFSQQDVACAVEAAKAAGLEVRDAYVTPDGRLVVDFSSQTAHAPKPTITSLYRHFAADGLLLYVGISFNAISRLAQHASGSHWFREIARVEIQHFDTRANAEAAEAKAIATEKPLHNLARPRVAA